MSSTENPTAWDAEAVEAEKNPPSYTPMTSSSSSTSSPPQAASSSSPSSSSSSPPPPASPPSSSEQPGPQQTQLPPLSPSAEQAQINRRKSMGDQKVEAALRVMKQSLVETVGLKNWKSIFGEDIQVTHSPEMENALKRLMDLHNLYNSMSKVLAQRVNALKNLAQADDLVFRYFSEAGVHEQDVNLRQELVSLGEQYKHVSKITQDWVAADQSFYEHVNTFFHKAIDDCVLTARKYDSVRLEYDAFKGKLTSLEQELATKGTSPKLEKDLTLAREQHEQVKTRYDEICSQLLSKVEVLYDLKIKNLKAQIKAVKTSAEQYFGNGMRAFEVPDQEN